MTEKEKHGQVIEIEESTRCKGWLTWVPVRFSGRVKRVTGRVFWGLPEWAWTEQAWKRLKRDR